MGHHGLALVHDLHVGDDLALQELILCGDAVKFLEDDVHPLLGATGGVLRWTETARRPGNLDSWTACRRSASDLREEVVVHRWSQRRGRRGGRTQ